MHSFQHGTVRYSRPPRSAIAPRPKTPRTSPAPRAPTTPERSSWYCGAARRSRSAAAPAPPRGPRPGRAGPPPSSPVSPPDISQMSPEQRATRLYNRVMSLHSQGQADSADFFLPMALQAYAMLPALDVDARYHMGVLYLTAGNAAAALAQADTIRRVAPTHLFGFMLRARALELTHDTPGAVRPYP